MTALLVILSVIEIVLAVAVLAVYIILITRRLQNISLHLGKISFGVRAVDTQTASIGPAVLRINSTLEAIDGALDEIAAKAARAAETT